MKVTLWCECSFVHLLHIFKTSFPKNISGGLLLDLNDKSEAVLRKRLSEVKFLLIDEHSTI